MLKCLKYLAILVLCLPLILLWLQGAAMLFGLAAMVMAGCDAQK